jgi:hypothetical protein
MNYQKIAEALRLLADALEAPADHQQSATAPAPMPEQPKEPAPALEISADDLVAVCNESAKRHTRAAVKKAVGDKAVITMTAEERAECFERIRALDAQ